jgi:hypothetical protein
MITTAEHQRQFGDIVINDNRAAGLSTASLVRASKLTTLAVGRITRRLGSLSETDRVGARVALRASSAFS